MPDSRPHPPTPTSEPEGVVNALQLALGVTNSGDSPINELPTEILVSIFELLHRCHRNPYSSDLTEDFPNPRTLALISSVCRRWRDCAVTTPLFWRDIVIGKHPEWLGICLARSQELPLHIAVDNPSTFVRTSMRLFEQIHRIRLLVLDRTTDAAMNVLNMLLGADMPVLEELRVDGRDCNEEVFFDFDEYLPTTPSLRAVTLHYAGLYWRSSAAHGLRSIILRDASHGNVDLTFEEFLHCLEACKNLERLILDWALPVSDLAEEVARRGADSLPTVPLPHIRELTIYCPPTGLEPDVYHILSHLKLPPQAELRIYAQITAETMDEPAPESLLDHIPCDPSCLPILRTATKACLSPGHLIAEVGPEGKSGGACYVDLDYIWDLDERVPEPGQMVEDFCTLFARARLMDLRLDGIAAPSGTWEKMFTTFSAITRLSIAVRSTYPPERILPVLAALGEVRRILPSLVALRIDRTPWDLEVLDGLALMLQRRAHHGLPPLSKLVIKMYNRDKRQEEVEAATAAHEQSLNTLKSLVKGEVEYADEKPPYSAARP